MWSTNCTKYVRYSKSISQIYKQAFDITNDISIHKHFFGSFNQKEKVYDERKLIGYSMEQIYSVVSDVGNYKKFVPFCKRSELLKNDSHFLQASLEIGFPPFVEKYISNVTLVDPRMVKAVCVDGRLFDHLITIWKFSPALKNNLQSCIIDFHISFQFKSVWHSNLAHLFFDMLVRQMEEAFIKECKMRYGNASVPSRRLKVIHSKSTS